MNRLHITLLGAFRVTFNGELLTAFGTDKARALLAYLAMEAHRPHRREHLAGLLWSDQAEKKALHSLRQSLSALRKVLEDQQARPPYLLADRDTIQFNPESDYWLDTAAFKSALERGLPQNHHGGAHQRPNIHRLQSAISLYQGNFLDQLILKGSPLFDEWAILQRELLTRQVIEAMCILIDYHERRGEFGQACKIAEQLVSLIPWEENAHRVVMRMLAQTGRWSAAEVQYQTIQRYLAEELGVKPTAETSALVAEIRQSAGQNTPLAPRFPNIPHNLPLETTLFIGREVELTELSDLLASPESRLLTLTGPGGIGKSRLALQAAREQAGLFKDGIFFVPLTPAKSHEQIPISIAEAIGFSFYAPKDPLKLLVDHLHQKDILLVLDNFEHLLTASPPASQVISNILNEAPGVVILATSRQPLNLRMEQIIELQGLTYPSQNEIAQTNFLFDKANYSGLKLFEQIAKRSNPRFSLDTSWQEIARICQLVEGTPLGIELSATWVRGYSAEEIARQIEKDFDFLATTMHDIPDRHRSMRSVFNHSWRLLDEDEKSILGKLTIFRGGFSLTAAEAVSGAAAHHIYALTDKSLLYQIGDGRFDMHNLVRQFASEELTKNTIENQETQDSHCLYFATYLQEQASALYGPQPTAAQKIISLEIENIRGSWQWATDQQTITALTLATQALGRFYNMRSWFTEGQETFAKTLNALQEMSEPDDEVGRISGEIATQLGWFEVQLGNYQAAITVLENPLENLDRIKDQKESAAALNVLGSAVFELGELETAKKHFEESLAISNAESFKSEVAFAYNYLGNIARNQGDFIQAKSFFTGSLQAYQQLGDQWGSAQILNNLGNMAGISGEYMEAKAFFEESLAVRQALDDQAGIAGCLQNLSIIAFLDEDYGKAKSLRQKCLAICRNIGFTWGIASTLKHLGDVDKALGNLHEARKHYAESLSISERNENRRSVAFTLNSLGGLALLQDEYQQASDYYQRAFVTAMEVEVIPLVIDILMGIATLYIRAEKYQQALELIGLAQNHPGTEKQTRSRANQLQTEIETHLSSTEIQEIKKRTHPKSLQEYLDDLTSNKNMTL